MSSAPLQPGMMVVHGNRMEDLRALTVGWLQSHPLAPLENEVILVQSNGVAQWLKLALARAPGGPDGGIGIAAAIDVQLPSRFLWQAYRAVLGPAAVARETPYDKAPLIWRIMRLLPSLLDGDDFAPLAAYLEDDVDLRKRYQLAERLADLFDQYQVYRADWLRAWTQGDDQLPDVHGRARPLPEGQGWQAQLWRALVADIAKGSDGGAPSRAEVHARFLDKARQLTPATRPPGLPRRVIVFGISSLPAQSLEALSALASACQVMMFVHNPCQHYWADIVTGRELLRAARRRHEPKAGMPADVDEASMHAHAHPLLAAWGRQGRDYIRLLDEFDDPERYRHLFRDERLAPDLQRIDLFSRPTTPNLLGQLQNDILELRSLADANARSAERAIDPAGDDSIVFHIAHGPQRELEILHDQLLDRFQRDRTLQPRDIIVMVPDIDAYAPHVQAVFGQFERDDPRFIPFTLADRRQRGREPLLAAVEHLLTLPDSRFAASEILDLIDVPAVRARFGIRESDLPTLHRWIDGAGVRWGLHARQRQTLDLPANLEQNTWRFGLRRMLLGYAVGDGPAWQGIEPHDEVGGLDAAMVGPLAQMLARLEKHWQTLARPATPADWGLRLRALLADFFKPEDERDELLVAQLDGLLESWLDACDAAGFTEAVPLNVVRESWLGGLDQGGLSQRFMGGSVNFCTLMPMRAIPFRVVCLLGMNDGDYPRIQAPADFDLMARDYRPGDRSRREDDRYLFLEALLSARDQFYLSWVGRNARDNSERPPSVLLGQLRDHLDAGWRCADGRLSLAAALTTEHALQPFSPIYFGAKAEDPRYFSYAHEWLGGAPTAMPVMHSATLPPPDPLPTLRVADLGRFLRNPVQCFFNRRLKVFLEENAAGTADSEPFGLDSLERHRIAETLLQAALDDTLPAAGERLQRQGRLPIGGLGDLLLERLTAPLPDLVVRHRALADAWPAIEAQPTHIHFEHGGLVLDDWLSGCRRNADGSPARLLAVPRPIRKDKQLRLEKLLGSWTEHLAANAAGLALTTHLVAHDETLTLPPVAADAAVAHLRDLLAAFLAALCRPLPVAPGTALAWLSARDDEASARRAAALRYDGSDYAPGECSYCPYLGRQYPAFEQLAADGEFADWAVRLYGPWLDFARAIEHNAGEKDS